MDLQDYISSSSFMITLVGSMLAFGLIGWALAREKAYSGFIGLIVGGLGNFIGLAILAFLPDKSDLPDDAKRKRQRSWVIAGLLFAFIVLVYIVAAFQMRQLANLGS